MNIIEISLNKRLEKNYFVLLFVIRPAHRKGARGLDSSKTDINYYAFYFLRMYCN